MTRTAIRSILILIVLSLFLSSLNLGLAGTKPVQKELIQQESIQKEEEKITVSGKINYMEPSMKYFLQTEKPTSTMLIVNPNSTILKKLIREGKKVTIEGRMAGGADLLFIDKIDGKPYTAHLNR